MDLGQMFHQIPLWLFYAVTVAIVMFSVVCGLLMGRTIRQRGIDEKEAPIGAIVGAMLGLLAFILALSFSMAATRFDTRKQLLLDEVNTLGTTFLRTDLLPASQRAESRKLLKAYVDIRVNASQHSEQLSQTLLDSEAIHERLWSQITALSKQSNDPVLLALYIQSLNDVIDLHSKRVTVALQYHIPGPIWVMLYIVTILTMISVGYQFGATGTNSWMITLFLALSFSAVIMLIADLDRSTSGVLKVSQKPLIDFQKQLRTLDL